MSTAAPHPIANSPLSRLSMLGIAAVLITGVALIQRGPDTAFLPGMQERPVTMSDERILFVQQYEVTIEQWNRCADDRACDLILRPGRDKSAADTPATGLNYLDAQQYVDWINRVSGHDFRLPTAEEWRVMAAEVLPETPDPIFTDPSLTWASSYRVQGLASRALKPQGSFSVSPEGVADLDGSVWEWTGTCYAGVSGGTDPDRCPAFFVGGEHVAVMSFLVRDPERGGCAVGTPPAHLGMRLVSDKAFDQQ